MAVGALVGIILGLLASLLVRPPIVVDNRLLIELGQDDAVHAVFLGGSLTDSRFATSESAGFRPLVADGLGVPVDETRGNAASESKLEAVALNAQIPATTNLVIIELGSTDVYVNRTDPQQFSADYRDVLNRVRLLAPSSQITCLGVWGGSQNVATYDKLMSDRCFAVGGAFVPLADIYETPGMKGPAGLDVYQGISDDFHPNDAGYSAIAQRILGTLRTE